MGAREDFMVVRRAAQFLSTISSGEHDDPVACVQRIMKASGSREVDFIRLYSTPLYAAVVDYAYAVLSEKRPGGPAGDWTANE